MSNQGYIVAPDLISVLDTYNRAMLADLNCVQVATIVAFDPTKLTAKVKIAMKQARIMPDKEGNPVETYYDYPIISDCPVWIYTGGQAFISMPIQVGDECLLMFNDRDIGTWLTTGSTSQKPPSKRLHSYSDAIVLVGLHSAAKPIEGYSLTDIVLKGIGQAKIEINDKVGISNPSTSLKEALNDLCSALTSWVDTHGDSPNGGTIAAINNAKDKINAILK